MSRDPEAGYASDPKTLHKYLYVGGDPLNWIDPSGRMLVEVAEQEAKQAPTQVALRALAKCASGIFVSAIEALTLDYIFEGRLNPRVIYVVVALHLPFCVTEFFAVPEPPPTIKPPGGWPDPPLPQPGSPGFPGGPCPGCGAPLPPAPAPGCLVCGLPTGFSLLLAPRTPSNGELSYEIEEAKAVQEADDIDRYVISVKIKAESKSYAGIGNESRRSVLIAA